MAAIITNVSGQWRGDDLAFTFTLIASAVPEGGIAGWKTEMKLSLTKGGTAVMTLAGEVTDSEAGVIVCPCPAAQSTLFGSELYYWDFRRTDSGSRDTLGAGTVRFDAPNT